MIETALLTFGAGAVMAMVVLLDIGRAETLRIVVYPKPLTPHLWRYGSVSFKLYRHIDYGWPALVSLYVSLRYHRHVKLDFGA